MLKGAPLVKQGKLTEEAFVVIRAGSYPLSVLGSKDQPQFNFLQLFKRALVDIKREYAWKTPRIKMSECGGLELGFSYFSKTPREGKSEAYIKVVTRNIHI